MAQYLMDPQQGWALAYAGGAIVMLAYGLKNSQLVMASLSSLGMDREYTARVTTALIVLMALVWVTVVMIWILNDSWPEP